MVWSSPNVEMPPAMKLEVEVVVVVVLVVCVCVLCNLHADDTTVLLSQLD